MAWLGSSAALAILSFDVDAESPILAEGRRYASHPMVMSHQAYGPLVGVPRILALLEEYSLPATFFVPGLTAERYPETVERIAAAGHEVGHHGYSHLSPVRLDEAGERSDFERGLAALDRVGVRPEGYRTPSWEASERTFDLLAEHGLVYDSTLMDDDRPYVLETAHGPLVELPPHWALDDWNQYMYLPDPRSGPGTVQPPARAVEVWRAELDGMRRHGCLFCLTMHPFLSGRPGRIEALRSLIEHALVAGDVEFVECREAARRALGDPELPRRELRRVEVDPAIYPVD
ncbi:MAG TPA: polysaccharide deacetylase [Gaiellaceae bacterium]